MTNTEQDRWSRAKDKKTPNRGPLSAEGPAALERGRRRSIQAGFARNGPRKLFSRKAFPSLGSDAVSQSWIQAALCERVLHLLAGRDCHKCTRIDLTVRTAMRCVAPAKRAGVAPSINAGTEPRPNSFSVPLRVWPASAIAPLCPPSHNASAARRSIRG